MEEGTFIIGLGVGSIFDGFLLFLICLRIGDAGCEPVGISS